MMTSKRRTMPRAMRNSASERRSRPKMPCSLRRQEEPPGSMCRLRASLAACGLAFLGAKPQAARRIVETFPSPFLPYRLECIQAHPGNFGGFLVDQLVEDVPLAWYIT